MTKHNQSIAERLDNVMQLTECGCHIWMGCCIGSGGYGHIKIKGKMVTTHRLSWELHNGPIPEGMDILHACDIPSCINPDHLSAGTQRENSADMLRRGRFRCHSGSRHYAAKISEDEARFIKNSTDRGVALAKKFRLSDSSISRIRSGKGWKYLEDISS